MEEQPATEIKKVINIIGTNNRYSIKKVMVDYDNDITTTYKKQKQTTNEKYYDIQFVKTLVENYNHEDPTTIDIILFRELSKKLAGYKQQDIKRKLYDINQFITMKEFIEKIKQSNMTCYFCNSQVYIFYTVFREMSQLTLDRNDNKKGHTNENTNICCLKCNIQKRNKHNEAFLFSKNLKLEKLE